jgi:hypothetical protein
MEEQMIFDRFLTPGNIHDPSYWCHVTVTLDQIKLVLFPNMLLFFCWMENQKLAGVATHDMSTKTDILARKC